METSAAELLMNKLRRILNQEFQSSWPWNAEVLLVSLDTCIVAGSLKMVCNTFMTLCVDSMWNYNEAMEFC